MGLGALMGSGNWKTHSRWDRASQVLVGLVFLVIFPFTFTLITLPAVIHHRILEYLWIRNVTTPMGMQEDYYGDK